MKKGDRTLIKQMNQQLVLRLIQRNGPIARRDIANISGLSPAAVSGITNEFVEQGLVRSAGEIERKGRAGRRAILLELNPTAGYVVGVSLAMHRFTCALTDLEANILYSADHPLPQSGTAYEPVQVIAGVIAAVEELLATVSIDAELVLGLGIGINGIVQYATGVSKFAPHYEWYDVPVAAPIEAHFGIPVFLENDVRALTLAEQLYGAGREVDNFVTVAVGYGIGAGVVIDGNIYRGNLGGAGEIGHIIMQPGGPICSCGRHGCLEALTAVPAIVRMLEDALAAGEASVLQGKTPLSLAAVADAVKAEDALALRVVTGAGRLLGRGLSTLVNMLNPQLFIISGEAVNLGQAFLAPMETAMRENAFIGFQDSFRIVYEAGEENMWARGVACVVLNALFTVQDQSLQLFAG